MSQKLKILCFHGYRQSGELFRQKTGSLRKALKKEAEFFYLTAPNIIPPLENVENEDGGRAWWFSREDDYFNSKHQSDFVKGFEESLKYIENYVRDHGPFDGFLGFSQGASMVALLCHLQEVRTLPYRFYFGIIVAGFIAQSTPLQLLYKDDACTPTLHVIGETDQVIGKEMSEDLLKYFSQAVVLKHPGGHHVPASSAQKDSYINFLLEIRKLGSNACIMET